MDFTTSTSNAKTGHGGKGLLKRHPWYSDDLPRLWDITEKNGNRSLTSLASARTHSVCNDPLKI